MISLRSKITKEVLADMFLRPSESFYVNEMARKHGLDSGNLTRKLHELESEGILKSETRGRERYYSLNKSYSLLDEYRRIVLKTVGVEASLKTVLESVPGIKHAYIFGSYAANNMDSNSDIDVLAVGEHRALDLQAKIAQAQKKLSREVNVTNLSSNEYEVKKKSDHFIRNIEKGSKVVLI